MHFNICFFYSFAYDFRDKKNKQCKAIAYHFKFLDSWLGLNLLEFQGNS